MQVNRKLDQLTITRFLAALSVVFFHGGRHLHWVSLFPAISAGPTAVGYFFVLSGFVMALAYYRPGQPFSFRSFWLARFSRIYPVYVLAFVLTCIYYLDIMAKIKPDKIWANIFLYQAWFPQYALSFNIAAWSLSVEAFFYLVFPFLIVLVMHWSAKKVLWSALGFWVISQIVHAVLFRRFMPEGANWLNYFPFFHLNAFLLGVAGGIWYLTRQAQQPIHPSKNLVVLFMSTGSVLLILSLRPFMRPLMKGFSLDAGLLAPIFLLIILSLALDTTRLSRWLSHPRLVLPGDASYALYILHVPFIWLSRRFVEMTGLTLEYGIFFSIYLILTIILCILVYIYIERPARDWLRTHAAILPLIFLDVVLIMVMIQFSFWLRLGDGISGFLRTQNLAVRVGVTAFFLCLLSFRFYITNSWRALFFSVVFGTVILSGFLYAAWIAKWVEGFPRSIILLMAVLIFASIYLSRFLPRFLKRRMRSQSEFSQ
jgi:peptidoglycan/LPS O-acetylase OafA/YrhL